MSALQVVETQRATYMVRKHQANLFPFEENITAFRFFHITTWFLQLLHTFANLTLAFHAQQNGLLCSWKLWIALLADFFLTIPEASAALDIVLGLLSSKAAHARPSYEIQDSEAPSVDIVITCCGEPVRIVTNTIKAAAVQNYPSNRYRIFILDDAKDPELRHAVEMLKSRVKGRNGPTINYLSREKEEGAKSHFKSGNLRFGIEASRCAEEGSQFLAGLDADMIVEPQWLRRLVPHLLLNDNVALVCGPQVSSHSTGSRKSRPFQHPSMRKSVSTTAEFPTQNYYNVPPSDPLGQQAEFDMYFTVQEILNDSLGAPLCTGTGYVARRSALESIGGWPLAYTGEDYMLSALLTGHGWEVAFVREPMQVGLAPESLRALLEQRVRWLNAGHEVHQRLAPYLSSSPGTSKMKASVKAVNRIYMLRDYSPLTTLLSMLLLPLVLFPTFDANDIWSTVSSQNSPYLPWTQRLFLISHTALAITTYITYHHVGLSQLSNIQAQDFWAAPYSFIRCLFSLLPSLAPTPTFTVTGTLTSPVNERSPHQRVPLPFRLLSPDMLLYTAYTIYASIPLISRILLPYCISTGSQWTSIATPFPFPGLMVRCARLAWAVGSPVRYMLWPPDKVEWEQLLVEGEDGVLRPRREWRGWGRKDGPGGDQDKAKAAVDVSWTFVTLFELWIGWMCL